MHKNNNTLFQDLRKSQQYYRVTEVHSKILTPLELKVVSNII